MLSATHNLQEIFITIIAKMISIKSVLTNTAQVAQKQFLPFPVNKFLKVSGRKLKTSLGFVNADLYQTPKTFLPEIEPIS